MPARTMHWIRLSANLLLLGLLAWTLAGLIWKFLAPAPAFRLPALPSARSPQRTEIVAPDLARITSLFGTADATGQTNAGQSTLPFKLRGVITTGKGAAVLSGVQAKEAAFAVGDELQQGMYLRRVASDHVVIDNRGREERILLDAKPAISLNQLGNPPPRGLIVPADGQRPAASTAPETRTTQVLPISMPRARLIGAMQNGNIAEWATGLRTDPRKGIRIEAGSARSLVDALQLQEGDVLQRINGKSLSHPGDIALVYNEFSQKNKIQLELLRTDRPLMLDYALQP